MLEMVFSIYSFFQVNLISKVTQYVSYWFPSTSASTFQLAYCQTFHLIPLYFCKVTNRNICFLNQSQIGGIWLAQSMVHVNLDLGVVGLEPHFGYGDY